MKKKCIYIVLSVLVLSLSIVTVILLTGNKKTGLVYANGQIGLITKNEKVKVNNKEYQTYKTTNKDVYLNFESFNMYEDFDNHILINETHKINISPATDKQNDYISNRIKLVGLNIVDGKIKITFKAGKNNKDITDTFWIRNVSLDIDGTLIKSNEDKNISYSRVINMGSKTLKSNLRVDYVEESVFDFEVDNKLMKQRGVLLDVDTKEISIESKGKTKIIENPIHILINSSLENDEVVTNSKNLKVDFSENVNEYKLLLNGVEINNNLKLNKDAWSVGNNKLEIIAKNESGFMKSETINFVLTGDSIKSNKLDFQAFDYGVNNTDDTSDSKKEIQDVKNYKTAFTKESQIGFVVKDGPNKNIVWEGKSLQNRVVYLELYNNSTNNWEIVSSMNVQDENEYIIIGYNYTNNLEFVKNNEIKARVVSKNVTTKHLIDKYIYHSSDVQYISRNGTINVSSIAQRAKDSFKDMADHMIDLYEKDILEYVVMTGDFVQSTVETGDIEWPIVMDNLINPLLEADVPMGTVSGNHDIGALFENTKDGVDTLDEFLKYDLWNEHLGEDVFKDKPYYGRSFENNRSHYDLIDINGHEFLFLYLGWGSSIKGIHVSEKDINFAKEVLEQYPNKTVVIGVHHYMGNKTKRTVTGEYLFQNLIKKYSNIQFVLSGHINGSSGTIDYIDDNSDGVNDRRVFQLLTDFQEEATENLGSTFIRRIGLDFVNNRMNFDVYSPVANDYQIFVGENSEHVKGVNNFVYDFDLNNIGYGLLTVAFGA